MTETPRFRLEILALWGTAAQVAASGPSRFPEKEAMSRHHANKLIQNLLVAATSLCVGMILARAIGF